MDPLASSSSVDRETLGEDHYKTLKETLQVLERYRSLQNIIAILGEGELSEREKLTVQRAKKIIKFFSQPFFTAEQFTNNPGKYITTPETVMGVQKILGGEYDEYSDDAFYLIGKVEEAEAKMKKK